MKSVIMGMVLGYVAYIVKHPKAGCKDVTEPLSHWSKINCRRKFYGLEK